MAQRRIIARDELFPFMRVEPAGDRHTCRAFIELDGATYRCGRAEHDGIHDAFTVHGDGGAVRW